LRTTSFHAITFVISMSLRSSRVVFVLSPRETSESRFLLVSRRSQSVAGSIVYGPQGYFDLHMKSVAATHINPPVNPLSSRVSMISQTYLLELVSYQKECSLCYSA
jgi:hypothetical protein